MKKIIIFNWKMNPNSLREATLLFRRTQIYFDRFADLDKKQGRGLWGEVVIAPPFIYLPSLLKIKNRKSKITFGSQNVFWENIGAYTGEISPEMLKNLGVEYVIIGHSERRRYLGETDEMINKKVLASLRVGLKVVLCVGEDLSIRQRGLKFAQKYVKEQLERSLKGLLQFNKVKNRPIFIAYEPIWAISTEGGKSDNSQDVLIMTNYIRNTLNSKFKIQNSKLLYGGSVSSQNVLDFLKHKEIDGVLIGGASLKIKEIKKIIKK